MASQVRAGLLAASVLASFLATGSALALPARQTDAALYSRNEPFPGLGLPRNQRRDQDIQLRILSLGASIMSGTGSTTGDGYVPK
jgi:hypothetical protein